MLTYLSKRKFSGKVSRNPKMKLHYIANLNLDLSHIRDDGIQLVNIGAPGVHLANLIFQHHDHAHDFLSEP